MTAWPLLRSVVAVVAAVAVGMLPATPTAAHDSNNHPGDDIYRPDNWNGWKIYLSPAHHWAGPKGGCDRYVEDITMPKAAQHAAHVASLGDGSLQDRGYRVRVAGDPDDNVRRSNRWGSDRHISIHSNAAGNAQCGGAGRGTRVFWYEGSPRGRRLAEQLRSAVGSDSPGSPDSKRTNNLYELRETNMPAAYLEAEFHDWRRGKNWLIDYDNWSWRIGYAVDVHLGYP